MANESMTFNPSTDAAFGGIAAKSLGRVMAISKLPDFFETMGGSVFRQHLNDDPVLNTMIQTPALEGPLSFIVDELNQLPLRLFEASSNAFLSHLDNQVSDLERAIDALQLSGFSHFEEHKKLNIALIEKSINGLIQWRNEVYQPLVTKRTQLLSQFNQKTATVAVMDYEEAIAALSKITGPLNQYLKNNLRSEAMSLLPMTKTSAVDRGVLQSITGELSDAVKKSIDALSSNQSQKLFETVKADRNAAALPKLILSDVKAARSAGHHIKLPYYKGSLRSYLDILKRFTNSAIVYDATTGSINLNEATKAKKHNVENYLIRGIPGIGKTEYLRSTAYKMCNRSDLELMDVRDAAARLEADPDWMPEENQSVLFYTSMADAGSMDIGGMMTTKEKKLDDGRVIPIEEHVPPLYWQVASLFKNAIYVLDEINTMRLTTPLLSLLTVGVYQNTRLAENSVVIGISNFGKPDDTTPLPFSSADINRWRVLNVYQTVEDWIKDYAAANVHVAVHTFMRQSQVSQRFESYTRINKGDIRHNMPTFRSMSVLSDMLFNLESFGSKERLSEPGKIGTNNLDNLSSEKKMELVMQAAYSCLGEPEMQQDFATWYIDTYSKCVKMTVSILTKMGACIEPERVKALEIFKDEYFVNIRAKSGNVDEIREKTRQQSIGQSFLSVLPSYTVYYMNQFATNTNLPIETRINHINMIYYNALEAAFYLTMNKEGNHDTKSMTDCCHLFGSLINAQPELVDFYNVHVEKRAANAKIDNIGMQTVLTMLNTVRGSKNEAVKEYAGKFFTVLSKDNNKLKETASSLGISIK